MGRYIVKRRYSARGPRAQLGPWPIGVEVDMSTEDAEWVNRDSPGVLEPVVVEPVEPGDAEPVGEPPAEPEPGVEPDDDEPLESSAEAVGQPAKDRRYRGGRSRGN